MKRSLTLDEIFNLIESTRSYLTWKSNVKNSNVPPFQEESAKVVVNASLDTLRKRVEEYSGLSGVYERELKICSLKDRK